jgi:DNA sulfur modification protein DndC
LDEYVNIDELAEATIEQMREVYLRDDIPWVVGFSGGKDSSTVVQLVYRMLLSLPPEQRKKTIHVIASDTLVESPVVERFLDRMLTSLREGVKRQGVPMVVNKVVPELNETYWVNVLGKGYPAPNRFFRWCTERLKIDPTTRYIQARIDEYGSVIILLGARKQESSTRAQVLENYQIRGSILRRHATMPQALIFAPIEDWTYSDVWNYLSGTPTCWDPTSGLNSELRSLYKDASGECPLVIDTSTPSCGQSRFGCWTCTVVNVDTSMEGFIETGGRYSWMEPLLNFRNKLKAYRDDATKREPWRRNSKDRPNRWIETKPDLLSGADLEQEPPVEQDPADYRGEETQDTPKKHPVLGPFRLEVRMELLRELLEIQKQTGYQLIQDEELALIRRYWTEEYRVGSLAVLEILEEVFGPAARREQVEAERKLLEKVAAEHNVDVLALDRLLDLERGYVTKLRKRGMLPAIDTIITELTAKEAAPVATSEPGPGEL